VASHPLPQNTDAQVYIMKLESQPNRPFLDEYETLYLQAEALLSKPNPNFEEIHKLSNQLKLAVRKVGLNSQKFDHHLNILYEIYKRANQMVHRLKPKRPSIKRQPMLIITTNEVDLYYLANSPLKRKSDRVVMPLSEKAQNQRIRFEEKYQERKSQEALASKPKPKRERTPLYSKHDLN